MGRAPDAPTVLLPAAALAAAGATLALAASPGHPLAIAAGGAAGGASLITLAAAARRRRYDERARQAREHTRAVVAEATGRADLLDRLLEATFEGVLLVEETGNIAYANSAAARLLGGVESGADARAVPALADLIPRILSGRESVAEERDVHLPARRRLAIRGMPFDGGGVLLLADVTDLHRAAQSRRDFVANVSHELKTPVAGISLLAEQLASALREDPAAAERFAKRIRVESERLAALVADLLDLSRAEGELPLAASPLDAQAVLREAAERVAALAEAKRIHLEIPTGAPVPVTADGTLLTTALANLLDNAVRYAPDGSRVRAAVSGDETSVSFIVEDEGPGIPSEEVARIFERFYRVDRARARTTGGTGLGLAIVKHVAERHGGRVEAASELGRGSRFTLALPSGVAGRQPHEGETAP